MRFDDLLRDAETQAGVSAELLTRRPLGVEALEHGLQLALWNAGAVIRDGYHHGARLALRGESDGAAGRCEGHSVADEVAEHLAEAALDPGHSKVLMVEHVETETRAVDTLARLLHLHERVQQLAELDSVGFGARQLGVEA